MDSCAGWLTLLDISIKTLDSVGIHNQCYLRIFYETIRVGYTIIVAYTIHCIQLYGLQVNPKALLTVHFQRLTTSLQ